MAGEADDQELQRALLMSLQNQHSDVGKRSKPQTSCQEDDDAEARHRRMQRELRAAAAEQRMMGLIQKSSPAPEPAPVPAPALSSDSHKHSGAQSREYCELGQPLSPRDAHQLFSLVFGPSVSSDVLTQWCNQGFRFSPDSETSLGLVQREGGPCGVLAPVQALVLKYLLFEHNDQNLSKTRLPDTDDKVMDSVLAFSEPQRTRALTSAMAEILWLIGEKRKCTVAVLDILISKLDGVDNAEEQDEVVTESLEGVSLCSAPDLERHIRIYNVSSMSSLLHQLRNFMPLFRSRVGALLFLFSALLSRGLEAVQLDRDDPAQPLVTAPFGHASQEIVNLLICGHAVPNVFDGNMDLGGGMQLRGIPANVEVGFLTLLEALNLCKVGQFLKRPKWPIWVVGSESHYTVLFALDSKIQDENDLEDRERRIRQAFDSHDQSGGGGFIGTDALQQLLHDLNINMSRELLNNLCSNDFVVWNELWQALHQVDKSKGGLKDCDNVQGVKQFELYHFNGIAKTVANSVNAGQTVQQRPRLTRLRVSVPPKWTPEEYMMDSAEHSKDKAVKDEPAQHAPLVDCIKTRWQRASCNWSGDAPSIV